MDGIVNARELAKILNMTEMGIHFITEGKFKTTHVKKQRALFKEEHDTIIYEQAKKLKLIDLNEFIKSHKLFDFEDIDYYNLIEKEIDINEFKKILPEYITSTTIKNDLGVNTFQIKVMRESGKVEVIVEPTGEQGKRTHIYKYKTEDVFNYLTLPEKVKVRNIQQLFISIYDLKDKLENEFGIKTTYPTINRRISTDNLIPAIRVRQQLRIPIALIEKINKNQLIEIFERKTKKKII